MRITDETVARHLAEQTHAALRLRCGKAAACARASVVL